MEERNQTLTQLVGNSICKRRKSLEMSQEYLAELVGIGQQSLSRMEQGLIAPKFERLQLFANALRCRVVDLFMAPEESKDMTVLAIKEMLSGLNKEQRAFILHQTEHLANFLRKS